MPDYILITPVLNEQENIESCIVSVLLQTQQPLHWIIIDGGSTDLTKEIITSYNQPWITVITQSDTSMERGHKKFSLQMREAYELCKEMPVEYIGKLDADCSVSMDFFGKLITECEQNRNLGAVSGKMYTNGIPETCPDDEIFDIRLYRKSALYQVGGFPVTEYSPDTIILAKLRLNGWKIQSFPNVTINSSRKNENNAVTFGKARYYLGYSVPLFLLGCGYAAKNNGISYGLGLLRGYFGSMVARDPRTDDAQIYEYFHWERLREVLA